MRIQIAKSTPLAWAPDAVCEAVNAFTEHEAFVSNDPEADADLIHFNNTWFQTDLPAVIQYHSEPGWKGLMLEAPKRFVRLVNAQYQALLQEYEDCRPVRQVINFHLPIFDTLRKPIEGIKIGYSPTSRQKVGKWHDKGYVQTVGILAKLKAEHGFDYDVIEAVSLGECIRRKKACNVIVDECVTGSYHRSGLEGLALGKFTVGYIGPALARFLKARYGHRPNIFSCDIAGLADCIEAAARNGSGWLFGFGFNGRLWMAKHWHPADVVQEYIKAYEEAANA